ncbi:hypothetical protein K469DRAFT_770587 [Zopfia rhizophila CBS 207.26]|uniref:Fungal-type protein kinase domain-containing protein n=1 Tax=Zopfia rhizophila CBS 207.26 TaxID=1314779 RepID=A0A6A6E6G9_9PEZI|nr:hypothetical protein K469DRAFT_770587 [Zopfia rhizophila CBS 207.26]
MAAPPIEVFEAMEAESLVNGVWFHILSQVFTFPTYIIAPEYVTGDHRRRGDLFVIRVADRKAVFAYEGKKAEPPEHVVKNHSPQIKGYLKDMRGTRSYAFGVLAAGTSYCILQWEGSNLHGRIRPLPMLIQGIQEYGPKPLNLVQNYGTVIRILRSIEVWITENVN